MYKTITIVCLALSSAIYAQNNTWQQQYREKVKIYNQDRKVASMAVDTGQPHQNSIQNMFCNRFVKIVLKKMCYLGNKADIADSKTLTMKNNLSDWIFYVSILQPKSFDYDS